jgi:broad specificity phosphatase PhoE
MMLYLFRHGKSEANTAQLVTGTRADPLVDEGRRQAKAMGQWLEQVELGGDRFFTSDWLRAQQTSHLICPDAKWEIDARLGETDAGLVADWPLAAFAREYPDFYRNNSTKYPDGESHMDLNRRVTAWLHEVLDTSPPDEKIVVVTHSGPIACLLQHALMIGMDRFPALLPAHASLTVIEYSCASAHKATLKTFSLAPAETARPMLAQTKDR